MGKIDLEIFEDTFLKKNSINYELSILVGVDSLCYALFDNARHLLGLRKYAYDSPPASFRDLTGPVSEILRDDAILQRPFARVRMAFFHPYAALTPNQLYREQDKKNYLDKITLLESGDHLLSDELPFANAMAVYPVSGALLQRLKAHFPESACYHLASCQANIYAALPAQQNAQRVFLNMRHGMVQLFAFDNDELLFFNTFTFSEGSDLVYFAMLVYQELAWKPEEVPVYVSGLLVEDSAYFRNLARYFSHIQFLRPPATMRQFGPKYEQSFREHWFLDLLSISHATTGYADYRRGV